MKRALTVIGGLATIAAMFLAFVKAGDIEVNGMQIPNNVGYYYIGCGAVIAIIGFVGKRGLYFLSLLLGLIVAGLGINYFMDYSTDDTTAGMGIWALITGGVFAIIGSAMALIKKSA